ncbi:MAG: sigma-70 region 4 domain-containing protein [Armatimonadetes bacterium]|nr:sigma-70 region 4 domain-containing protein [Armatimonadota bacterium]
MTSREILTHGRATAAAIRRRLPSGRQRQIVSVMLLAPLGDLTYPQIARFLEMSLGTLHTHLRRLKRRDPELHAWLMNLRRAQAEARHAAARERQRRRKQEWRRRRRAAALHVPTRPYGGSDARMGVRW